MNKSITMKTALAALACTACVSASAQKQYPEQEKMKPGMSEYWTPQPKVVTPGDIKTNSAPSDAIVLFDGKDLSAWQNAKGGPAEWIVKDGVFTVDKKKRRHPDKTEIRELPVAYRMVRTGKHHRHKPRTRQQRHLPARHV